MTAVVSPKLLKALTDLTTIRCPVIASTNNRDETVGALGDARKGNHDEEEKPISFALFGFALS